MDLKKGDILYCKKEFRDYSNNFIVGKKYVVNSIEHQDNEEYQTLVIVSIIDDDIELMNSRDFNIDEPDDEYYLWQYVININRVRRIAKGFLK